jgi:uncharacterized surface protein with fasciclin (FAS1) repeats
MSENIVDTAREAGSFTTRLAAVDAAGLGDTLAGDGPFTVFAPATRRSRNCPPARWSRCSPTRRS